MIKSQPNYLARSEDSLTLLRTKLNDGLTANVQQSLSNRRDLHFKIETTTNEKIGEQKKIELAGSPLLIHNKDSCSYKSLVDYMKSNFSIPYLYKLDHNTCGKKRQYAETKSVLAVDEEIMNIEDLSNTTPKKLKKVKLSASPLIMNDDGNFNDLNFPQTPVQLLNKTESQNSSLFKDDQKTYHIRLKKPMTQLPTFSLDSYKVQNYKSNGYEVLKNLNHMTDQIEIEM